MMEDSTAVTVTAHHPSSPLNENDEGEMDDSTLLLSLLDRDGNECPPSLPERELWSADALTRAWTAAVSEFKVREWWLGEWCWQFPFLFRPHKF